MSSTIGPGQLTVLFPWKLGRWQTMVKAWHIPAVGNGPLYILEQASGVLRRQTFWVCKRDKGCEGESNTRWRVRKVMSWSTKRGPSIETRVVGMPRGRQVTTEENWTVLSDHEGKSHHWVRSQSWVTRNKKSNVTSHRSDLAVKLEKWPLS